MGRFLALSVLKRTIPYLETQVTAQGLTAPTGGNFVASSSKAVDRLVNAINTDVVTDYENMKEYMIVSTCDFSAADIIIKSEQCGCECGNSCQSGTGCLSNKRKQTNAINFW